MASRARCSRRPRPPDEPLVFFRSARRLSGVGPNSASRLRIDAGRGLGCTFQLFVASASTGARDRLDDELVSAGAPFDICDTVTLDEAEEVGLTDVLLSAVHD